LFKKIRTLKAQYKSPRHPPYGGKDYKNFKRESAQTEKKTKIVFRKARENEQNKDNYCALALHESIKPAQVIIRD
jgi:hypothetical protein